MSVTGKTALSAFDTIVEYCNQCGNDCESCIFSVKEGEEETNTLSEICVFESGSYPADWDRPRR